jgi:hypothetical protein
MRTIFMILKDSNLNILFIVTPGYLIPILSLLLPCVPRLSQSMRQESPHSHGCPPSSFPPGVKGSCPESQHKLIDVPLSLSKAFSSTHALLRLLPSLDTLVFHLCLSCPVYSLGAGVC